MLSSNDCFRLANFVCQFRDPSPHIRLTLIEVRRGKFVFIKRIGQITESKDSMPD